MNFRRWFKDRFQRAPSHGWERHLSDSQPRGDFRGPYGFGRRAHRPDPKGHYSFGDDPTHRMHHPQASSLPK
jgi:hypothetical protein